MANKKTIIKKDLAKIVAQRADVSVLRCEKVIDDMMDIIASELQKGRGVKLAGFGSLLLRDKRARPGRNPKTKEEVTIPARRVVLFKSGTFIKNSLRRKTPSTKLTAKEKKGQ
ncbi:MAG: HU family DNA-binding protein [Alphaproteobacteria bacterium]|nr:HU family DNA-binding protein [Alphaproteobacteria bacterium]